MIQLCLDNIDCDIVNFEQMLLDEENIKNKETAVSLYRGPLYEEENYNWICLKDGYYDNKYMDTLNYLYEHYKERSSKQKMTYYGNLINSFIE